MKKNVAFLSFGVGDLTGGGGAERFFADLFDYYSTNQDAKFKLLWLIDKPSIKHLNAVKKLKTNHNISELKIFSNRFKKHLENIQVLIFIVTKRIEIIHIPWYNFYYLPFLNFIQNLPKLIRPKISINIVDCQLPFCYMDQSLPRYTKVHESYDPLFKDIHVDGYFAWNTSFINFMKSQRLYQPTTFLQAINSRFCDTSKFFSTTPKEKKIVFASRLAVFKNADWFLGAILYLKTTRPELIKDWQFIVCGDGPLRPSLIDFVKENNLSDITEFRLEGMLENVLNTSMCFVSCQDFDNFPSLSMAEAMAAGNVIVSRNVGQTNLFVEDTKNGFLAEQDSPEGIAHALIKFLENLHRFEGLSQHSVYLMKEVHTPENFIPQIDQYWNKLITN